MFSLMCCNVIYVTLGETVEALGDFEPLVVKQFLSFRYNERGSHVFFV